MSIKIEGVDPELMEVKIEIDVENTKNLAYMVEKIYSMASKMGLIPHIKYVNFPILNKHKNLSNELQIEIWGLIREKIDLEQKIVREKLRQGEINSHNGRWLSVKEAAELVKIVNQERRKKTQNLWSTAQKMCVDYLNSIDKVKGKRLDDMDPKVFEQYIRRNTPKKK